ncbi:glycosyltransferase family 4 protein [Nonlabens antarcticus]|uniref:glycosyltransferase family 4 protein n=1 Tax=Nonlabens antarcticus TaxID=392714 RepID=UPI0018911E11|nr:glycosyltransferase family 4 protein [Nonlabens antarcticus]
MKTRIIYIGNKLAIHGKTATTIDTLAYLLEKDGAVLRTASSKKNLIFRLMDMLWTVHKNRNWADRVLIDTYSTRNFWYAEWTARLCRIYKLEYIPILHGGNLPQRLESHPKVIRKFLEASYQVVSPSNYLKSAFAKAGYHNITVIPNSIALENYTFLPREQLKPKLLWVRSFADIYNPQMAIEVLELLLKEFPDATLIMVGPEKDGSLQRCKEFATSKKLSIEFTGLLTKDAWIEQSKRCDIFINTSRFDNMPVSVLEAMALGLPVVSTNVGGIAHLIQDQETGLLVPDGDAVAMHTAIIKLLLDPEFAHLLSNNGRDYVEKLDWNYIKIQWHKLLGR